MLPSVHHASTDEPDRLAGLPLAHARPVDRVTMRSNVLQREILMALVSIARDTGDFALALRPSPQFPINPRVAATASTSGWPEGSDFAIDGSVQEKSRWSTRSSATRAPLIAEQARRCMMPRRAGIGARPITACYGNAVTEISFAPIFIGCSRSRPGSPVICSKPAAAPASRWSICNGRPPGCASRASTFLGRLGGRCRETGDQQCGVLSGGIGAFAVSRCGFRLHCLA